MNMSMSNSSKLNATTEGTFMSSDYDNIATHWYLKCTCFFYFNFFLNDGDYI